MAKKSTVYCTWVMKVVEDMRTGDALRTGVCEYLIGLCCCVSRDLRVVSEDMSKKEKKSSKEEAKIPLTEQMKDADKEALMQAMLKLQTMSGASAASTSARSVGSVKSAQEAEQMNKDYKFWKTQPVTQLGDTVSDYGKIIDRVRKEASVDYSHRPVNS